MVNFRSWGIKITFCLFLFLFENLWLTCSTQNRGLTEVSAKEKVLDAGFWCFATSKPRSICVEICQFGAFIKLFCKFYRSEIVRGHAGDIKTQGWTHESHFYKNIDYENYDNMFCLIFFPYLQVVVTNDSGQKNDTFAWNLAK